MVLVMEGRDVKHMSTPELIIGTRGSRLATTQAGHVRDYFRELGYTAELTIIKTEGDVNMAPVERIGVGVFTQALREAMARGECNVAVHSFKDLPTAPDPRFHLVVPQREDPREALIGAEGTTLENLPQGAKVGTSAPRRISQLRAIRPDLDIQPLRGNIDTRLGKVTSGELDAVILAAAGLSRMEWLHVASEVFGPRTFIPAPAQGALAVECPSDQPELVAALDKILAPEAMLRTTAERAFLRTLEAGCTAPVAAHAVFEGDTLRLWGGAFAVDGSVQLVDEVAGPVLGLDDREAAAALGRELANTLLAAGAADIMAGVGRE